MHAGIFQGILLWVQGPLKLGKMHEIGNFNSFSLFPNYMKTLIEITLLYRFPSYSNCQEYTKQTLSIKFIVQLLGRYLNSSMLLYL